MLSRRYFEKERRKKENALLPRPLPRRRLVPRPVRLVQVRNLGHEGVVRVGVGEEGADREEDCHASSSSVSRVERGGRGERGERRTLGDGQRGGPLFPENVEANRAVRVDTVRVVQHQSRTLLTR